MYYGKKNMFETTNQSSINWAKIGGSGIFFPQNQFWDLGFQGQGWNCQVRAR